MSTAQAATIPTLHRFLGIGLVVLAGIFLALRYGGAAPVLPADGVTTAIGYGLAGVAVMLVALALLVFKPRAPTRGPLQSVDDYWSTPEISAKVLLVWVLLEGAGTLAGVGYLLTGELVSATAMALAIVTFWLFGPNAFANT